MEMTRGPRTLLSGVRDRKGRKAVPPAERATLSDKNLNI